MPKVSVLLTSYNHADYIEESIDSILNQTFKDFELFIVDDCSTDDSWNKIKKYKDKRITSIRNERNKGVVIEPKLLSRFSGKYLAIAHCDDKWKLNKLEKQVEFLDNNEEYAACFTDVLLIDDTGKEFCNTSHHYYDRFKQKNRSRLEWLKQFFYEGNVLCHPSILIRLDKQMEYNLYVTALRSFPDMYRWIKLCLHDNIYVLNEKLTYFRVRNDESNTSGDRIDNLICCEFDSFTILDEYKEVLNYTKKDFCTVFPTAKKYFVKGENDLEYIFARILIDSSNKPYQLYGMKLMWTILQDDVRKDYISNRYNYTPNDLINKTSTLDVFGTKNNYHMMNSTLFYDCGNNFNENDSIKKEIYVNANNKFLIDFNLENLGEIRQLRFDPDENKYIQCKNMNFEIDGEKINYITYNYEKKENWISFNTSDPQFILDTHKHKGKVLHITGEVKNRNYKEIDELLQKKDISKENIIKRIANRIKK